MNAVLAVDEGAGSAALGLVSAAGTSASGCGTSLCVDGHWHGAPSTVATHRRVFHGDGTPALSRADQSRPRCGTCEARPVLMAEGEVAHAPFAEQRSLFCDGSEGL